MPREFRRVAIVNRGEAAMRFVHAAREFNLQRGASLSTIALFTEPDRHAMFVREADEAVFLGPAQIMDPDTQVTKSTYVDYGRLEKALTAARADAVWVGWGFVAEQAEFADLCKELGITFIGPTPEAMRLLGDKISSKCLAEQAGIPVAPWSGGPVETLEEALHHAMRLGFPLLVKATAGGGGQGIRVVHSASELAHCFEGARSQVFKAFGNPTVFLEQMLQGSRHVEVQVIADHHGTTWAVGVRDCTIQRRHQKILEEARSPVLSTDQDQMLREAAVRLSQAAHYTNAGTVEFLYDPDKKQFAFMEMNTRLQVEHPVTECTTGLDLVKLQLHVALGGRLEGDPPRTCGHAIEVRLNAEDAENNFAAAPGTVERFRIVTGPGVRVDTGILEGDEIAPEFDSMIAKIIAYGSDRKEALSRLQRALRQSVVVIKGGASNKAFLQELLSRPEVQRAEVDVKWLDRLAGNGEHLSRRHADVALLAAATQAYDAELEIEQAQFYASALRGRPQVQGREGRIVELRYRGQSYSIKVSRTGRHAYVLAAEGARIPLQLDRLGQFEYWLTAFGRRFHLVSILQGSTYRIEVDGVPHRVDRDDGGVVHAPAPAVVVSIAVKPGDNVAVGDRLAVLEAMKMEMEVVAPFSGKVRQVMIIPNVQVDTGAPLLQIEPIAEPNHVAPTDRVLLRISANTPGDGSSVDFRYQESLNELRQLVLGFDVDPKPTARQIAELSRTCTSDSDDIRQREEEILRIFMDVCTLFQRQPTTDDSAGGEGPSSEAYLFTYLRMLETRGEALPHSFVEAVKGVLAHYGVRSLDRSPELEESLLWICKSHKNAEKQVAPILAMLERRLRQLESSPPTANDSFRSLLDGMIGVTNGQFPAISDMAREVRYRYFDQPLFEGARKEIYRQVESHVTYLTANPNASDRHERIREMVDCPQPLLSLFADNFAGADSTLLQLIIEVLTWRYYRVRALENCRCQMLDQRCCVAAEYDHEGKRIHLFTTHTTYEQLADAARALFPLLAEIPPDHDVAVDFYTWHVGRLADAESTQTEVQNMLNQAGFPRPIRRIVVAIGSPGLGRGMGGMQHFTYRPSESGYQEEKLYRGLHPMMGKRLHLWRLSNFNIERLPSVDDVYLLRAVAKNNPKDERLFACAEVRDLTPVRDEKGRIVQLPHLERMLMEALAEIRLFQSRRSEREKLFWNRVFLYVWPPLYLKPKELHDIVHRLAPATEGLGLEQVVVRARIPNPQTGELRDMMVRISSPCGRGLLITFRPANKLQPIKPLAEYDQKVVRMRQRGLIYPYEIFKMLTPPPEDARAEFPPGEFTEYDIDPDGRFVPVDRPYGQNKANIIAGVIRNFTNKYPEGMTRVLLAGDPSKDLGALAEAECRRIIAALDLATEMRVPLEWFPISAGAKISMESGVENMDWIARVLRRLVEFTQAGGEVNLVINGINVGAQPYWNAEATMLMHTRGILIMTPKAAMVLTGKRALDYSVAFQRKITRGSADMTASWA
jgi:acetyl/propionyl-CoA carboxylase alpha subunit